MWKPTHEDSLQVLLLQAADEGRGEVLFGESLKRVAREAAPFLVGRRFPSIYLECPLSGDPFLDITVLYTILEPGAAFARGIPAQRDDGSFGRYGFTLMPQWTKARWRRGVLQPAKMYFLANACFTEE